MRELDESLLAAARKSEDCVDWLEHCKGVCCRQFIFRLNPTSWVDRKDGEVWVHLRISSDERRYYELHGARVAGRAVVVPEGSCEFTKDHLIVNLACSAQRPDYLCSLHPDGKPEVCSYYTLETVDTNDYLLQPKCLYRYKLELKKRSDT